jgi:drug/metabolite transporter (DMT)-like permease
MSVLGSEAFGMAVVVLGVLTNAISAVLGRQVNREKKLHPIAVTVASMGVGSVALLLFGVSVQGVPTISPDGWLVVGWLAVVNTAFAFPLWNHTLRTLSAVESSIINSTMLVQIALLAWLFLGEELTAQQIGGMVMVGLGMLIVQLRRLPTGRRGADRVASAEVPEQV